MPNANITKGLTSSQIAARIVEVAAENGFTVSIRNGIFVIRQNFKPSDIEAFVKCDALAYDVLSLLPRTRGGSDWGTDGGSVGGHIALSTGVFSMNRSGGSPKVLDALAKII